eukprot:88964_1
MTINFVLLSLLCAIVHVSMSRSTKSYAVTKYINLHADKSSQHYQAQFRIRMPVYIPSDEGLNTITKRDQITIASIAQWKVNTSSKKKGNVFIKNLSIQQIWNIRVLIATYNCSDNPEKTALTEWQTALKHTSKQLSFNTNKSALNKNESIDDQSHIEQNWKSGYDTFIEFMKQKRKSLYPEENSENESDNDDDDDIADNGALPSSYFSAQFNTIFETLSNITKLTSLLPSINSKIQDIISNQYLNTILNTVKDVSGKIGEAINMLTDIGTNIRSVDKKNEEIYNVTVLQRENRTRGRFRDLYNLDMDTIIDKFQESADKKDNKIEKLILALERKNRAHKSVQQQLRRANKKIEKFQKVTGKKRIITTLSINVKTTQLWRRDRDMEHYYKNMQFGSDTKDYIRRRDKNLRRNDAVYKDLQQKQYYGDIIKKLNKDSIELELDEENALITGVTKIIANSSHAEYHTLIRNRMWNKWTEIDSNGKTKIRRKRKKHENGLLVSYGPSNGMIQKAMKKFKREHPELDYKSVMDDTIYYMEEMISGIILYLSYWARSDSLAGNYAYHEETIKIILNEGRQHVLRIWFLYKLFIEPIPTPYIKRWTFEALQQLECILNDPLNYHIRSFFSSQQGEGTNRIIKKFFRDHFSKRDIKKAMNYILMAMNLRNLMGTYYSMFDFGKLKESNEKRGYYQEYDDNNYKPEHFTENEQINKDLNAISKEVSDALKGIQSMDVPAMFKDEFGDKKTIDLQGDVEADEKYENEKKEEDDEKYENEKKEEDDEKYENE